MPENIGRLFERYQRSPESFSVHDAEKLRALGRQYGIELDDPRDINYLYEVPKQLLGGLISGFTAFVDPFEEPKDVYTGLAKNVGHLFGFVGSLFGTGGIGGILAKGLSASVKATGLAAKSVSLARATVHGAEALQKFRSVPMFVADRAMAAIAKSSAAKAATGFLRGSPILEHALKSGLHLGIASSVSSFKDGLPETIKSGLLGMAFGGAFARIGDISFLSQNTTANTVLRAISGSLVQGLPSVVQGAPTPVLVEQFLMGAFFGGKSVTAARSKAIEFLRDIPRGTDPRAPETANPALWVELPKNVQEEYRAVINELYQPQSALRIFNKVFRSLTGSDKFLNSFKKANFDVGTVIHNPETGDYGPLISAEKDVFTFKDVATGQEKRMEIRLAELYPGSEEIKQVPSDVVTDQQTAMRDGEYNDFDVPTLPHSRRELLEALLGKKEIPVPELAAHIKHIDEKIADLVANTPQTERRDIWAKLKEYANDVSKASSGKELSTEAEGLLNVYFNRKAFSLVQQHAYLDNRGQIKRYLIRENGRYLDADNNLHDASAPIAPIQILTGDRNIYFVLESMINPKAKGTGKLLQKIRDSREPINWGSIFEQANTLGYYPFAGVADKSRFIFMKRRAESADIERLSGILDKIEPGWRETIKPIADLNLKQLGLSDAQMQQAFFSNLRYWEIINEKPLDQLWGKEGFIQTAIDFNKRMQIMFTNYYPISDMSYPDPVINYALIKDYAETGVRSLDGKPLDKEASDGAILTSKKSAEKLQKNLGFPLTGGFIKPFIVSPSPEYGTLLGKAAIHVIDGPLADWMDTKGVTFLIHRSSAKQWGKREFSELDLDDAGKPIWNKGAKKPAIYSMQPHDLKVDLGIKDDVAKIAKGHARLVKQLMTSMFPEQTTPAERQTYSDYLRSNYAGDLLSNQALKEYLDIPLASAGKRAKLEALVENHMETLGLQEILNAMKADPLFRSAARHYMLFRKDDFSGDDILNDWDTEGVDTSNAIERTTAVLDFLRFGSSKDGPALTKMARSVMEQQMVSFFVRRATRPLVQGAGKAYMRSFDIQLQKRLNLTEENFFLDESWRGLPITGIDENGSRKKMTLGEQFELYQKSKAKVEDLADKVQPTVAKTPMASKVPPKIITERANSILDNVKIDNFPLVVGSVGGYEIRAGDSNSYGVFSGTRAIAGVDRGVIILSPDYSNKGIEQALINLMTGETTVVPGTVQDKQARITLSGKKDVALRDQIQRSILQMVVLRVPMDSISGAASLRLSGFTGYSGSGILLHANTMKRLGGADLDIDTAFFYTGLPEAMHGLLQRHRNEFTELGKLAPKAADLFIKRDPNLETGSESQLAMFSPYHRLKIAFEVSKGRGKLMGVAVNNRFMIHSLYSRVMQAGGKLTLDAKYGDQITLVARKDDGALLRAVAQRAINVAADLGKYGGMVEPAELRAILLRAAFEKITPKKGEDLLKDVFIDPVKTGEKGLTKEILDFAQRGLYQINEVAAFQKVNQGLYGSNQKENRNWYFKEIVEAAKAWPQAWDMPFKALANHVAGLDYYDSLISRFIRLPDFGLDVFSEMSRITAMNGETLFSFIPSQGKIGYKHLAKRIAFLSRYLDPDHRDLKGNLAAPNGATEIAWNTPLFNEFLSGYVKLINQPSVEALKLQRAKSRTTEEAGDRPRGSGPTIEKTQKIWDIALNKNKHELDLPEARAEFLTNFVTQTEDYLSSRLTDLASLKNLEYFFKLSGLEPGESKAIFTDLQKIKDTFDHYWLQRADRGRFNETPGSFDHILEMYNIVRKKWFDYAGQMVYGGRNVSGASVVDYVDSVMLSSFTTDVGTKFGRLNIEVTNPRVIAKFTSFLDQALTTVTEPFSPGLGANFIAQSHKQAIEQGIQHKDRDTHFSIFFPKGFSDGDLTKMPPKEAAMANEIQLLLKHYPNITAQLLMETMRGWYRIAQPGDLTIYEVEGLRNRLRSMVRGPGVMNVLFGKVLPIGAGLPFSARHTMQFVRTTADEWKKAYLTFHTDNIVDKEGNLKKSVPLKHLNEEYGRLEHVFADVSSPITHFEKIINVVNNMEGHVTQLDAHFLRESEDKLGWVNLGIKRPGSPTDESNDLFSMAVSFWEANGAIKLYDQVKKFYQDHPPFTSRERSEVERQLESLGKDKDAYAARAAKFNDLYNQTRDVTFEVVLQNKTEKLTGQEIKQRIHGNLGEVLGTEAYEKAIKIRDSWIKDNIVRLEEQSGEAPLAITAAGMVDLVRAYRGTKIFLDQTFVDPAKSRLSYDESRLMLYLDDVLSTAEAAVSRRSRPSIQDAQQLKYGEVGKWVSTFSEIRRMDHPDRRRYLFGFITATEENVSLPLLKEKFSDSQPVLDGIAKAEKLMANATKDPGLVKGARENAIRLQTYFRKRYTIDPVTGRADLRVRLYGEQTYSQYRMDVMYAAGSISPIRYWFRTIENSAPFKETGHRPGYWPHMKYSKEALNHYMEESVAILERARADGKIGEEAYLSSLLGIQSRFNRMAAEQNDESGFLNMIVQGQLLDSTIPSIQMLTDLGGNKAVGNMLQRQINLDGYSKDVSLLNDYFHKLSLATMRNLSAFHSKRIVRDFENKKSMGEFTETWSQWMRLYVRDALGGNSFFTDEILSNKQMQLKRTPYYWLSDHAAFVAGTKSERLAKKLLGFDKIGDAVQAARRIAGAQPFTQEERAEYLEQAWQKYKGSPAGREVLGNKLRWFSTLEGRYEMATLLFHSKTAVSNILGGTINNWVWTGSRHMWQSRRLATWQRINPDWHSMEDVYKWVRSTGAIEDFILHEGNLLSYENKPKWDNFLKDVVSKIKRDPESEDAGVFALAKKHGISEDFVRKSAFFMLKSERYLRLHAFLSSFLQAREMFEPLDRLSYDTPYLIEIAKKGIAGTQFLYSAANRPAFARTNLGKVYTRFKLWSWSSVKFQRQVYEEASFHGFKPSSHEFERLRRLLTANLFMIGLASLLPYTIFDFGLPAPLSYFQDLADWMFGSDKKRERAFFSRSTGLPTALAPLNELLPPLARIPKGLYDLPNTFGLIWGGDANKIGEYTTYTLFPFGRMTKDLIRAYNNPSMAADWLAGIPLQGFQRLQSKGKKKKPLERLLFR